MFLFTCLGPYSRTGHDPGLHQTLKLTFSFFSVAKVIYLIYLTFISKLTFALHDFFFNTVPPAKLFAHFGFSSYSTILDSKFFTKNFYYYSSSLTSQVKSELF